MFRDGLCALSGWEDQPSDIHMVFDKKRRVSILDSAKSCQYVPRGLVAAAGPRSRKYADVESMADDIRANSDRDPSSGDEAALSARLQSLGKRLGDHHPGSDRDPGIRSTADPSAIARGFRLSTELVAGVVVGAAIGWGLDRLLGISPARFRRRCSQCGAYGGRGSAKLAEPTRFGRLNSRLGGMKDKG